MDASVEHRLYIYLYIKLIHCLGTIVMNKTTIVQGTNARKSMWSILYMHRYIKRWEVREFWVSSPNIHKTNTLTTILRVDDDPYRYIYVPMSGWPDCIICPINMYIIADVKNDTSPDGNPSSRGVSRIIIISRGTATCHGYAAYTCTY